MRILYESDDESLDCYDDNEESDDEMSELLIGSQDQPKKTSSGNQATPDFRPVQARLTFYMKWSPKCKRLGDFLLYEISKKSKNSWAYLLAKNMLWAL